MTWAMYQRDPRAGTHVETGVKVIVGANTRINAALFEVKTTDELVVDVSSGGRTSYKNASKTLRQGGELSLESASGGGVSARGLERAARRL